MILGLGTDIVECDRIAGMIDRHGESFTHRIFTPAERAHCDRHRNCAQNYAGRWAAKEAAMKALGTGFVPPIGWHDFEVLPEESGAPTMHVTGGAAWVMAERGAGRMLVSISHCRAYATATVVLTR